MTPQVKPEPGTIWPTNVTGTIAPVTGFSARRPCGVVTGRYSTGGRPPQLGSNRSKLKAEASPVAETGSSHLYMRTPASNVSFRLGFHVSWANQAQVVCQRLSGRRPIDSV